MLSRRNLNTYRQFGNQLIPFAFACVITADTNLCDLAKARLLTYASWDQWGDKDERGLALAHMIMGNAIAYDWLYPQLSPNERQTIQKSLADWTQKLYEASVGPRDPAWNNSWRHAYAHNRLLTIHSALGVAALALSGEDDRAQTWLNQAVSEMTRVRDLLNGIKDGSWHEGMQYQNYALTMSLPFWVNLRRVGGIDLFPHDYLRNYPYWRIYNYLSPDAQFIMTYGDFEDSSTSYNPQNILRFVAREYNDGHAEWMAQQITAADGRNASVWSTPWYVFEFLYYEPAIAPQPPTDLANSRVFPDLEGVIWRTGWTESDLVFALKTGGYSGRFAFNTFTQGVYPWEPPCSETDCKLSFVHDHDDANGFYLYQAGYWLAPERAGYGKSATKFHNTLLIDDQGQNRAPEDAQKDPQALVGTDGFLKATADTPNFDYVAADATRRYNQIDGLKAFTRQVVFIRPGYLLMLDNLAAAAEHRYDWVAHFGQDVSIDGNWVRGNAGGGQILGIGIAAPQPFKTDTGNDGQSFVHIRPAKAVADVRFIHLLYPTTSTAWNNRPDLTILSDTGEAAAVRVQMNDGSGRTDDILLTYGQSTTPISNGPYEHDSQVAVVSRGANGQLEKLFVYGGTSLTDKAGDKVLVKNLDKGQAFEAAYSGQSVTVYHQGQTQITLYAPQAQSLTVNGQTRPFTRSGEYITF